MKLSTLALALTLTTASASPIDIITATNDTLAVHTYECNVCNKNWGQCIKASSLQIPKVHAFSH
jgi:uncharacterized membrane protein